MFIGKPKSNDPTKLSVALRNRVTDEAEKYKESLKNQVFGENQKDGERSLVHDILTEGGRVNPNIDDKEREEIITQDKRRLAELEEQIRRYRMQREELNSRYSQNVQSEFDINKKPVDESVVALPKGPKKGARGPGAAGKSKGSGEMLKSKK